MPGEEPTPQRKKAKKKRKKAAKKATKKTGNKKQASAPAKQGRGAPAVEQEAKAQPPSDSQASPEGSKTAASDSGAGSEARPNEGQASGTERQSGRPRRRRRRRGGRGKSGGDGAHGKDRGEAPSSPQRGKHKPAASGERFDSRVETGLFMMEKGDYGALRREEAGYRQSKEDIFVPKHLIKKYRLPEGAIVSGPISRGQKHRYQLAEIHKVDGEEPGKWRNQTPFKNLTSIDPDFHYAVGDITDDVSMRIVDLLCPIGRGQRGLIVAPPRTGKTTIMRQFAAGIEKGYPDVHLMIVLVDERPEEATEWRRSVERAQLFVSTSDETSKIHIQTAEAAWKRACRLVELGEEVVILLDSITRLARAYNNQAGSGRTMSGGLDSRAMERPRKIFGSARNTVEAGSLTILGTTLVQTGSRMDQMVFEEFKGTGNMEMVLNRKLADRRVFPAIDVEKAGTRKEEKLFGMRRVKLVHTLRRVLLRMNFIEAMELLITRLSEVDKTDDFLKRFEVDPDA